MKLNIANKLTLARIVLVPFFAFFIIYPVFTYEHTTWSRIIAAAIFILAAITDFLDGKIARKKQIITHFGKFMDPLADKLLVCTALICLTSMNRLNVIVVLVIIAREFIISGFRLVASDNGIVIAASYWGKFKTVSQMALIIVLIMDLGGVWNVVGTVLTWVALLLTVVSLIDYIAKNKQVLTQGGM